MIRYLRVSGATTVECRVAYYANKPRLISSVIIGDSRAPWERTPSLVGDHIIIGVPEITSSTGVYFEVLLSVPDNQPAAESVKEITTNGVAVSVYNENGVLICDNGVSPSGTSSTPTVNAPGEMTSEPIDGPGEMTSVPGEEPGEMATETTDEPGATI